MVWYGRVRYGRIWWTFVQWSCREKEAKMKTVLIFYGAIKYYSQQTIECSGNCQFISEDPLSRRDAAVPTLASWPLNHGVHEDPLCSLPYEVLVTAYIIFIKYDALGVFALNFFWILFSFFKHNTQRSVNGSTQQGTWHGATVDGNSN